MNKLPWFFTALLCGTLFLLLLLTVPADSIAQTAPTPIPTVAPTTEARSGSLTVPGSGSRNQAEGNSGSGSGSGSSGTRQSAPTSVPKPSNTCQSMMPDHIVISGAHERTECKVVGAVGIQSLDDAGITAAVDIWAWTSTQLEVCFRGTGRLVFLDATTAPRAIRSPSAHVRAAMTCTNIQGPGTVILSGGSLGSAPQAPPQQPAQSNQLPIAEGCQVTTTAILYVRATPGGPIIEITLPGTTLSVLDAAPGWYKVDYWLHGWVSADYVIAAGC